MKVNNWFDIDWIESEKKLESLQHSIVVAFRKKDYGLVKHIQNNLVKSFDARSIAVFIALGGTTRDRPWRYNKGSPLAVQQGIYHIL